MKSHLLFIVLPILLWCCSQKPEKSTINKSDSTRQVTSSDSGISSFHFTEKDTIFGRHFRTVETTYKVVDIKTWNDCVVKFHTITDKTMDLEGQMRTIQFELGTLDNPTKIILKTKHDCDEILFDWDHYQTIKYGCCGTFDQLKYYDYQGKLLVEGYSEIKTAYVPNRGFQFYLGFMPEESKDTTTLGTLQLSYSSSEIYHIKLKSLHPASSDSYPMGVYPNLNLRSSSPKDTYDKDQKKYSLSSLANSTLTWPQQVNGFIIRADFNFDPKLGLIDIPIIHGLPFGKEEKNQVYWVKGN